MVENMDDTAHPKDLALNAIYPACCKMLNTRFPLCPKKNECISL